MVSLVLHPVIPVKTLKEELVYIAHKTVYIARYEK